MRLTFFARKTIEATTHATEAAVFQRRLAELLTPPKGRSLQAWLDMRKKIDTPEYRAWIEEVRSSPTFEKDQKKIAERLELILEEAKRSNSYY